MTKTTQELETNPEAVIPVIGLHCAACARRIERRLGRLPGVRSAMINPALEQVRVACDSPETTLGIVIGVLTEEGATPIRNRVRLPFVDSTYGIVSARVLEERVESLRGVTACRVDLIREEVEVDYLPGEVEVDTVRRTIGRCGYEVSYPAAHPDADIPETRRRRHGESAHATGAAVAALITTAIHAVYPRVAGVDADPRLMTIVLLLLAIASLTWSMKSVFVSVARSILSAYADTRLLVTLAILILLASAIVSLISGGPAGASIVAALWLAALDRCGAVLDQRFKARMTESATSLVSTLPHRLVLERAGGKTEVDVGTLQPGERVTVAPGETIPADGHVVSGASSIDAALLGGESGRSVAEGDSVLAGARNGAGQIVIEVGCAPRHSFASAATRLLEQTREKTTVENRSDRLAWLGVPAALGVAIVVSIGALVLYGDAVTALHAMAAALVAFALPAAGLAASAAITLARDHAMRRGIVFDSNASLERLAAAESVTVDSSFLSGGDPVVSDFVLLDGMAQTDLFAYASVMTRGSETPVSRGVATRCASISTAFEATERIEIRGGGTIGLVNGTRVIAGPPAAVEEQNVDLTPIQEEIAHWSDSGKSTLVIAIDGSVAGAIALAPAINASDIAAVRELKGLGLEVNLLITGHPPAASALGKTLGATLVLSAPFRDRLSAALSSLGPKLLRTAVIAPAHATDLFARARLGVAMGPGRAPADPLHAPVTLLRTGTEPLIDAVRSSRQAMKIASANLVIASIGTVVGLLLAIGAFGIIPGLGVWPVAAMVASSAAAIVARVNGMRVGRSR